MFINSFLVGVTLGTLGYCGKEIYHTIKPKKGNAKSDIEIKDNIMKSDKKYYDFNDLFFKMPEDLFNFFEKVIDICSQDF